MNVARIVNLNEKSRLRKEKCKGRMHSIFGLDKKKEEEIVQDVDKVSEDTSPKYKYVDNFLNVIRNYEDYSDVLLRAEFIVSSVTKLGYYLYPVKYTKEYMKDRCIEIYCDNFDNCNYIVNDKLDLFINHTRLVREDNSYFLTLNVIEGHRYCGVDEL